MDKLPGMDTVSLLNLQHHLAVPLQTPHPRKVGLHGPACAPVGWLGVSSMGLCPWLPWSGACAFSNLV